ncbi:MAG: murein biosynthesis integral membrane protein MurJ, partial [Acidimicrobiales bacterium]
ILLSRIAGLLREVAISGYLGVGGAADAFKAALRIPNLLQNLLGEGVLSASFIPVYARLVDEEEKEGDAGRLAGAVAGLLCALTSVLVVLGYVLARPLTVLLTPGFTGERLDLAVTLLRIMFPGIGFLVLSAWCLGILNSHRRFFLSYVAPVLWNAAQIAIVVAVAVAGASEEGIARALAWGVLVGGLLQLAVQLPAVRSLTPGLRLSLDRSSPEVRSVLSRFGTVIVGRGAVQLLTYVDLFLASLLAVGAVSALTYGQVLYLLPISLFGMAVAAAELPELSRLGRQGAAAMRARLDLGMERITFYVALTASLYVFAGDVIVGALFQRGQFDAADTRLVWFVIGAFALGLLGTTRSRLLQNALYALDRPRLVARIAVLRVALAGLLGALLMFPLDRLAIVGSSVQRIGDVGFSPLPDALRLLDDGPPRLGIVGLALAASASSWIEYRLLRGALEWRVGKLPDLGHDSRWSLIAAGAVGVLAFGIRSVTDDLPRLVALLVVVVPATLTYLAITATMAVSEARVLVDRARRLLPG